MGYLIRQGIYNHHQRDIHDVMDVPWHPLIMISFYGVICHITVMALFDQSLSMIVVLASSVTRTL